MPPTMAVGPSAPSHRRAAPQAGIDGEVEQVDEQVHHEGHEHEQHHDVEHEDDLVAVDAVEELLAETGQREHVLDDDGADEQGGELQPEHGDDGDGGVAQPVAAQRRRAG